MDLYSTFDDDEEEEEEEEEEKSVTFSSYDHYTSLNRTSLYTL